MSSINLLSINLLMDKQRIISWQESAQSEVSGEL